jgi:hypothetical protein|nr:MAG TPA: TMEM9 [Caudoviricetes sp.]
MRKEVWFICERCGCKYETAKDAALCEMNHMTDLKIVKTTYSPDFAPNFPTSIEVESKEGIGMTYVPWNSDLTSIKKDI